MSIILSNHQPITIIISLSPISFSIKVYTHLGCPGVQNKRRVDQVNSTKKIRHRKSEDIFPKIPPKSTQESPPTQTVINSSRKLAPPHTRSENKVNQGDSQKNQNHKENWIFDSSTSSAPPENTRLLRAVR